MKYVDMHCDTITNLYRENGSLRKNDLHIDIEKMEKGDCLLQNFAIFTYLPKQGSDFAWAAIDYYYQQLEENKDKIAKDSWMDCDNANCHARMGVLQGGVCFRCPFDFWENPKVGHI